MTRKTNLSLYLHIPFCRHRCAYCDFNTYTSLGELQDAYAAALGAEVAQMGQHGERPVHTIFLGGGTPSLMSPAQLTVIMAKVQRHFALQPDAEITMEANPGTVDEAYLTAVKNLGINRISFGVQSAIPSELALLEREHDFETAVTAVDMARAAGIDNLNMDLIYGVPGQTLASWEQSLNAVLTLKPPHISLYCLTIEPGTPMQRWLLNGRIQPPDPDLAADQYETACEILGENGYLHYEISNWALPGYACEHNLTYWRNHEYLGLGAGAHGHAAGYRYHVVRQPRVYIRRLQEKGGRFPLSTAVADHTRLSQQEMMSDTIITQLRLLEEGLDLKAFAHKFGCSFFDAYPGTTEQLIELGLLRIADDRLLLTQKGWFLSNQVFYRFL